MTDLAANLTTPAWETTLNADKLRIIANFFIVDVAPVGILAYLEVAFPEWEVPPLWVTPPRLFEAMIVRLNAVGAPV